MPSILCPSCEKSVTIEKSTCQSCECKLPRRYGILSFTDHIESSNNTIERQTIDQIAELTRDGSIRNATNNALGECSNSDQILREIYDTRNDAWRMVISDILGGQCLDLYSGWGRRSLVLAELVDSVYAVDPDLGKMRILNARDDFDSSSKVIPIHADEKTLPFGGNKFDTIVADFTDKSEQVTKDRIETLDSLARNNGSILFMVDGTPRKLGVSGRFGMTKSFPSISIESLQSTFDRCRRILEALDYEEIRIYVLWPTVEVLTLVYDKENSRGHQHLFESAMTDKGTYSKYIRLIHIAERLNLLEYCFPNVLVVGSRDTRKSVQSLSRPVLSTGRSRSIIFEYDDDLAYVQKVPNRRRHSQFNEREHYLVQKLRTWEPQIQEYLPKGELIESSFGSIRKENPIEGRALFESIGGSLKSREEILSLGIDWLINFQQPQQRERVKFSPKNYINHSELKSENIDLSQLPDPIQIFEAPVHGDFLPGNIYLSNDEITTVIDWEYGCLRGNPIVDVGFFVARVIAFDRLSTLEAMVELWNGTSRFAKIGQNALEKYCDICNINTSSVLSFLPIVYLHRINIDKSINATMTYTNKEQERLMKVKKFWEIIDGSGMSQ